jgi:hypothetical protein
MKRIHRLLFGLAWLALTVSSLANPTTVKLLTANETGTYHQMGKEIQDLLLPAGINLILIPSLGSLTNVLTIAANPDIHLGFAQADVVSFPLAKDKIKILLPLYKEEVHLLATDNIKQLTDLNGKKVSLGLGGSGTFSATTALLELLKIKIEQVYLKEEQALAALRKGEIDAMFYVIGYPAKALMDITTDDKLHLVPIQVPSNQKIFVPSIIPEQTYGWQKEAIETIAVTATLITHTYDKDDPGCELVGRVAKEIYSQLDFLKKNGHDKWDKITFDRDALSKDEAISACTFKFL